MTNKIDINKKYQTRDGREVKQEHTIDVWVTLWMDGNTSLLARLCRVAKDPRIVAQKKFTLTIKEGEFDED